MEQLIAKCGLDCAACGAFQATLNNDDEKRKQVAAQWSRDYKADIKPEHVNCRGCQALNGVIFNYCKICKIRACALERGLQTCAACPDYGCEQLTAFLQMAPQAGENLEKLRKRK